jgi:hypothetical protein
MFSNPRGQWSINLAVRMSVPQENSITIKKDNKILKEIECGTRHEET